MLCVEGTYFVLLEPGSLTACVDASSKVFKVGFFVDVEQSFAGPVISHHEDPRELTRFCAVSHMLEPFDDRVVHVGACRFSHFRIPYGERTEQSRGIDGPLGRAGTPDRRA
jgi:hypothetical protein